MMDLITYSKGCTVAGPLDY